MTLKLYTFRGKHSGRFYYGTGHNIQQAALEIGIRPRDLILERSEALPAQATLDLNELDQRNEKGETIEHCKHLQQLQS